jgi:two-component system, chemotaxis family, protein-glutamate methylesterase/glutaminase
VTPADPAPNGKHDIIVAGASAGGIEALKKVVGRLPADLPAAVFVVVHVFPRSKSVLPEILSGVSRVPVLHAEDGMEIRPGRIYVAPPDHHLIIEQGHMHLSLGPKEQHQRPCINVTFRTAAAAYGKRVIGIVLTGQLDDGTAGLWEIVRHGGLAVVQNPEEADFPSMPLSALREVEVNYTVRLAEMGQLLAELVRNGKPGDVPAKEGRAMEPELTDLTCPDCRGTIWQIRKGRFCEYRCRVGHSYSPKSMLAEHFLTQERTLWAAVVALEEGASLSRQLTEQLEPDLRQALEEEAQDRLQQASELRRVLEQRKSFVLE